MKKILLLFSLLFSIVIFSQPQLENSITKIIIVRHAEKAKDHSNNPPLSTEGIERAERLSQLLSDMKIDKLYSTSYKRTNQTLAPLSKKFNLPIENYEASNVKFAEHLLLNEKGKTIVIAGHSNTAPALVNQLIKMEKYQKLDETVFSKIWIVTYKGDEHIDCSLLNY